MQKSIEETYQKKTPLQHVLLRPDTYVGSTEMQKSFKWVLPCGSTQFKYKEIVYVPALYKIFDEVLVNAADNYQRDIKMNLLKVQINQKEGFISVHNNGQGIPVAMHKQHNIFVPELIFGHLLTGSNYNDDEKKVVGGRNGYGAKLANIFSTQFIVECGDNSNKKKFKMVWSKNMTQHGQPEITKYTGKDFTTVTFFPEFRRFKMDCMDNDIFEFLVKRVYDMAGLLPKVKVVLNDEDIPINSFLKYVNMYYETDSQIPKIRDIQVDNERWQIVVSISEGQFRQVSFVNSICTTKGGTHVNYITDQIVKKIQQKIEKKDKNLVIKPFQVKAHLWVFVNCLVENPTFDSQTKQTMTLKISQFGSQCHLSDKMIKQILKSGIVDDIFNEAKAKQLSKLAKMTAGTKKANLRSIPKLEDANQAGTKYSEKCTLILTEGDSAKSLAMSGLQVIGRDYYGVFPLKGKLLNAREANNKTLMENQQVQNIIKILGLQIGKQYSDTKGLRYGALMIMSDQDTDGSHIKGLVLNFIHYFWPSLFRKPGFMKQFITPLLKVVKGRQSRSFFTMNDYKVWAEQIEDLKRWKVKYYKGLGTSTDKEAQQYFSDLPKHKIDFQYIDVQDDKSLQMVFAKKNVQKRKQWLYNYDPSIIMMYNRGQIRYKQFVDCELIHFSNEDNVRSIASIIDGFKPGQRKIMFGCFKRNLKEEIKVAQLAGYVAEHSAYHHGQMSLTQTIVGMAQNFVGSNNINILMPNGQFGSRNLGGKDHASARYIFTCLNKVTRFIYPEPDDHILKYIQDDGQLVEPQYYMPIIPMGLVNGCQGIGTGWSTYVPNFNPREIARIMVDRLDNETPFPIIKPWFKGYNGQIIEKGDHISYQMKGILDIDMESSTIHIRQLPVGKWTKDYKIFLDQLMDKDDKIIGLKQYHTKNKVHFELEVEPELLTKYQNNVGYFQKLLKITGSISMKNMVGFNQHNIIQKYAKVTDVLEQFFAIRLIHYQKRKEYLLSNLQRQLEILSMKQKFIIEVVEQKIVIRNLKKIKLCELLKARGYIKFSQFTKVNSTKKVGGKQNKKQDAEGNSEGSDNQNQAKGDAKQYNYLLSMPLWNLTFQKVQDIKKKKQQKQNQLLVLQATNIPELWKRDLRQFLIVLDQVEKQQLQQLEKAAKRAKHDGKQRKGKKKVQRVKKEKKKINWDSDSQTEKSVEKDKGNKKKGQKKKRKSVESTDKKSESKSVNKNKKKNNDKNKTSESGDFFSRIKSKYDDNKSVKTESNPDFESGIITRPKNNIKKMEDIGKQNDDYEIVKVLKKSNKQSKKMVLDSDEESDFQSQEMSDFDE